ncbi:hypothetical protein BCV73_08985 [Paenibacillus sp. SSG-1]|uniref:helix-turn-helix domain-containing protein n=1 Tax=Paenibacillus sp. SSG-1 TaxID=1443669 RepID=UPI000B7D486B|nr:helix-turn-helix transcriptional regulator [Paenibacillus sp. SSG-1]OXL83199.1 hypothetical protein BCV73_08985 [Paenibacillus sp. SSG-1]
MGNGCECKVYNSLIGLKELRKVRGLSATIAARLIGLDEDELIMYEDNPEEIPVLVAIKMACAYKCDYDSISFSNENNPTRV